MKRRDDPASYSGLGEETTAHAIEMMARRAFVASPAHLLGYFALSWAAWDLHFSPVGIFAVAAFTFSIGARFVLWKGSRRWLAKGPGGLNRWRLAFGICAWILALAWGLSTGQSIYLNGLNELSLMLLAGCLAVSAISIPAFAFDLRTNLVFQVLIFLPSGAALVVSTADQTIAVMGLAQLFWMLFMIYTVRSTHNAQIELLKSRETIERQREQLEMANQNVQTMLESIDEAYLSVGIDGVCHSSTSQRAVELLEVDPAGLKLSDVFFGANKAKKVEFEEWLEQLLHPNPLLPFEQWVKMGPSEIQTQARRTLKLKFSPVRDATGTLKRVIVTASDISREVEAREIAKGEQSRSAMILRAHEHRQEFAHFIKDLMRYIDPLKVQTSDRLELRRQLHALKGAARFFSATEMALVIHRAELTLAESSDGDSEVLQQLAYQTSAWISKEDKLLANLRVFTSEVVEIPKADIDALPVAIREQLMKVNLENVLRPLVQHSKTVSLSLKKDVELGYIIKEGSFVNHDQARNLSLVLPHLIVNAIDHGIERSEHRTAVGKPVPGKINITAERVRHDKLGECLEIHVRDDGSGIDLTKIARSKDIDPEGFDLIFEDGVSSKSAKTEFSGFGLGLGHVRSAIRRLGGDVMILESSRSGTTFLIRLPVGVMPDQKLSA